MIRSLRNWAQRYRVRGKYTPVGVTFHWIMAGMVIYQLSSGWLMPRHMVGPDKLEVYRLHAEIGLTLLLLGALRLLWRLMVPGPINDADNQGWRSTFAHSVQIAFYALFLMIPLSGWVLWSAIQPPRPLSLAGLVPVSAMPFQDLTPEWQYWLLHYAKKVHVVGIIMLSLLVTLHAAAAIKHHFWDRDDVFEGILPEVPDARSHPSGARYTPRAAPVRPQKGGD